MREQLESSPALYVVLVFLLTLPFCAVGGMFNSVNILLSKFDTVTNTTTENGTGKCSLCAGCCRSERLA